MKILALAATSVLLVSASLPNVAGAGQSPSSAGGSSADVVARILRADYEGDRAALLRLRDEVPARPDDARLSSRLLYWRGFASWRRAINGFNETVGAAEQTRDLDAALRDFEELMRHEPDNAEAKIGTLSCVQLLIVVNQSDAAAIKGLIQRYRQLLAELEKTAPENPRLHWVRGPSEWYAPPGTPPGEVAARQATAFATYERGLRFARARAGATADPLEPTWGEPELLMSLAWSYLNRTEPDLAAAEKHARDALALVPHWHYVRDILLPQIARAKGK